MLKKKINKHDHRTKFEKKIDATAKNQTWDVGSE